MACVQVIGAFVKLSHWLPLMVDAVAAPQASLTTRINSLVVLSSMLYASGTFHAGANPLCVDNSRTHCGKCLLLW